MYYVLSAIAYILFNVCVSYTSSMSVFVGYLWKWKWKKENSRLNWFCFEASGWANNELNNNEKINNKWENNEQSCGRGLGNN